MTMLSPYVMVKPAKPNSLSRHYGISSTIIPYVICSTNRGLANKAQLSTTTQWCPKFGHLWFLTWLTHGIIFTCLGLSTKEHDWGHHLRCLSGSDPILICLVRSGRILWPHKLGHHIVSIRRPAAWYPHDNGHWDPLILSMVGFYIPQIYVVCIPPLYPHIRIILSPSRSIQSFSQKKPLCRPVKKKTHQIPNKNSQNQLVPFGKLT